ncbi:MAG: F0F1 ATP synthase subunit gamma [Parcubacteria group bacterium GW2011_GWA2_56_7]|nr:MAG: F0F1 ATP synthase subunit gamma [Parcubacteria group bacterium GW2011_GWA2_56_7]
MALSTRVIKQRIKSVKNTKKITKAMELVAASKMRKAITYVTNARPFSEHAWRAVLSIASGADSVHPLLRERQKKTGKTLYILFASDRGLCGGYNVRVLKEGIMAIKKEQGGVDAIAIGKRALKVVRALQLHLVASFIDLTNNPLFQDTLPISKIVLDEYGRGVYDRVVLVYTDFVSALSQAPKALQLLPLRREITETVGAMHGEKTQTENAQGVSHRFEPSPEAGEMIDDLTLTFNQARQASITQEIAEISSGAAALA